MPRTAAAPDPERQLMIKTKACQRLVKEVDYYKKEVQENEAKLAAMKDEQRDPHDIKKFEEVLGESYMMIPDSQNRLRKNLEELADLLKNNDLVDNSEWISVARELLSTHHQLSSKEATKAGNDIDGCDDGDVAETNLDDLKDDEAF